MECESASIEILIVEDSPTQALHLQRLLEKNGYAAWIVPNGAMALEALKTRRPALIVSDIVMPGMDGYELCSRIKAEPRLKQIPVILLTVLSDPREIIKGLQCGADNFLVKPWDDEHLLAHIRQILANCELRTSDFARFGIEVVFHGQKHLIHADRLQMLDLLLASYEAATEQTAELRRAKEEAERANRAKTELLARVAHEMRTPLNAILGFGQLLQHGGLSHEDDESIRHILEGGNHLIRLTHEMTDISQIDAGEMALACDEISWEHEIEKCLESIQPLADKRHVQIHWESRGGKGHPVVANRERLREVLWNLLSNAVKYNREGGVLSILDEQRPDGTVRISISDTGSGIPPQDLPLLFMPFERLGAEKRGIEGSGLGLALARKLAEIMGGRLGVKSVEGAGSTFWVDLPTLERSSSSSAVARN